jgi:hypothetical protein
MILIEVLCLCRHVDADWSARVHNISDGVVIDAEHCNNRIRQTLSWRLLATVDRTVHFDYGSLRFKLRRTFGEEPLGFVTRSGAMHPAFALICVPPRERYQTDLLFASGSDSPDVMPPPRSMAGFTVSFDLNSIDAEVRARLAEIFRAPARVMGVEPDDEEVRALGRRNRARAHELSVDAEEHRGSERERLSRGAPARAPVHAKPLAPPNPALPVYKERRGEQPD